MKRLLALLLAALMLLSLAACGGKTETAQTDAALIDDGTEYHGEMPIVKEGDEPITLKIGLVTNANVTDYKDNDYTKWLEEQTGLKLEFMQFSGSTKDIATQVALMIASGEKLPDILKPGTGISKIQADEYGLDGYFIDLKPYFEKYAYHHTKAFERIFPNNPEVREIMMLRAEEPSTGKIFSFAKMEHSDGDRPVVQTWINTKWLEKLGLSVPTTVGELREVLIAFRDKDPNGNGKQDEIPLSCKADSSYADVFRMIINAYVYWNPHYDFNVDENGKLWIPYNTDEYRAALCFISDLVKDGVISTLNWTQSAEERKNMFNPATSEEEVAGVLGGHGTLSFNPGSPALYDYDPIRPFKAETPLGGYAPLRSYSYSFNTFITADCEHPVEAFKLLDFMSTEESFLRGRDGVPGRDWEFVDAPSADERGGKAFRRLVENPFSTQNSINWHGNWSVNDYTYYNIMPDSEWSELLGQKTGLNYTYSVEAGQPEKTFTFGIYTREEDEIRTEIEKDLQDFIKDRRAQFCTGVLDPYDDAQWKEYLDGLETMRCSEWIALAQTAYDRLPEQYK